MEVILMKKLHFYISTRYFDAKLISYFAVLQVRAQVLASEGIPWWPSGLRCWP